MYATVNYSSNQQTYENPCLSCISKRCEKSENLIVIFFPHEVKNELYRKFPWKYCTINRIKLYYTDGRCQFFNGSTCDVYGSDMMPLDCKIYPFIPKNEKAHIIDSMNCELPNKFNEEYVRWCWKIVKGKASKEWLKVYWQL